MESPDSLERLRSDCAQPLDQPGPEDLRWTAAEVMDFALAGFAAPIDRPIGASPSRAAMEALLGPALPEQGTPAAAVLQEFCATIAPNALRPDHPRFLAFIAGAPSYPAVLGDWLGAAFNVSAGLWKEAAGAAQVELVVLDWFRDILGLPPGTAGILTSGGSEAILTALVTARATLPDEAWPRAVLYTSDQRHRSVDRGAYIAGFRGEQVRILPADADQRLAVDVLARAVAEDRRAGRVPWLVVATAGTTNTGAVDPLDTLADYCRIAQLWLHVDAAYGWAAALTEDGRQLLHGIGRADSVSLDPHKWFAQTFDVGCLLVKHGPALAATFSLRPEYLQDVEPGAGEVNFADRGIALTRRFRALKIWFSVQVLGIGWFRRLVEHGCNLATLAERLLEAAGFEIVGRRSLSVVCFRLVPDSLIGADRRLDMLNRSLCAAAVTTGMVYVATTRVAGAVALRMCFVNWRTTAGDVETVVRLLSAIGQKLAAEKWSE